jgi:2-polyprenyl-6-methoxyphenol hydroxylase-like FAD-dependent oxidoreductase
MTTRTATIIGGGVAGAATALALHKAGIESVIYEANPDDADGVGVFLTLATNGIDALRVLEADGPVLERGFPTPAITLRSGTGKRLGSTPTGVPLADGTVSHTLKRSDLYSTLCEQVRACGLPIEHGKRLVDATYEAGGVRARFQDGTTAFADVLIGCDGVHSTVRGLIDASAPAPRYEGLLTTGGYTTGVAVDAEPGTYEMIFGKRGFFGYAPAPDGQVWWFANVPSPQPPRGRLDHTDAGRRQMLLDLFADDAGPACPLVKAAPSVAPLLPVHTFPHLGRWHRGGKIVIGDAAHAPSPTSGQGASLSVEDAVLLAMCLRDADTTESALDRFVAARRERVERIVKWAARFNRSKAAGPVGRVFRDALLPPLMQMTAGSQAMRQSFDYHLDWNASTTERVPA